MFFIDISSFTFSVLHIIQEPLLSPGNKGKVLGVVPPFPNFLSLLLKINSVRSVWYESKNKTNQTFCLECHDVLITEISVLFLF